MNTRTPIGGVTHILEGQPQMQVQVILASRRARSTAAPLVSLRMRYPRPIHAEMMTPRVFGRNGRSSRAVPVRTMLDEVRRIPYVPWHWGRNQKGMQAGEPMTAEEVLRLQAQWLEARDAVVRQAEAMMKEETHKQNPNRILEPFTWMDFFVTSNRWKNFLWLRDHKDADPHMQDLAILTAKALDEMEVQDLEPGDWHLPWILPEEFGAHDLETLKRISAARSARISYTPFDGNPSIEREMERYDSLVNSDRVHASPLEHQATPDAILRTGQCDFAWANPHLHGNLPGFVQFRKQVSNEAVMEDEDWSLYQDLIAA